MDGFGWFGLGGKEKLTFSVSPPLSLSRTIHDSIAVLCHFSPGCCWSLEAPAQTAPVSSRDRKHSIALSWILIGKIFLYLFSHFGDCSQPVGGQPYDDTERMNRQRMVLWTTRALSSLWQRKGGRGVWRRKSLWSDMGNRRQKKGYHFVEAETLNFSVLPRWFISSKDRWVGTVGDG